MRAVIQRVSQASVVISENTVSEIKQGLLVLLGVETIDNEDDIEWLSGKIARMRIFSDENEQMNLSVKDVDGDIIVVSQFTLFASTKKGNRPGFTRSARPEIAIPVYEKFVAQLSSELGKEVFTGEFGANMQVDLCNDGPVTIIIDTRDKQ